MSIVNAIMEGAVRVRGLLLAQTYFAREAIFEAIVSGMEQYHSSDGLYRVPMPAIIGSGGK